MFWETWTLWLLLHDVGSDSGGHSLQFENSVRVSHAESVCMNIFVGANSLNSVTCHPSMRVPSLARVFDGESGGVSGMICRGGEGQRSSGWGTARVDALLHDETRSVLACRVPRIQGFSKYLDYSCARWSTSPNPRPERRPELWEEQKWSRRSTLCKVRQVAGESLLFLSSCQEECMSRRGPVATKAST